MIINAAGFDINYNQLGKGKDVLILHGWGCDITLFDKMATELAKNFRVTLADMPGHGLSKEPTNKITVYDYANIVLDLLNKLDIKKTSILAHSFGCRLSIILASKHPEKIDKLLLCGAAGVLPKRSFSYYFKVYKYKLAKKIIKIFAPKKLEKFTSGKGSSDYKNLSSVMKATFSCVVNEDLTPLLKDIKAPTFLIWGENDTETPLYMAQIMEAQIPDCKKIVYKSRTHYAFLEESARTLAIANTFFN